MRSLVARVALLACVTAPAVSCGISPDYTQQDTSQVILRIVGIVAQGSGLANEDSAFLLSDVVFKGSVFNDNATLQLQALNKNANIPLGTSPGPANDVILDRYDIVYRRSDGLNEPGVDVPFPISSGMTQIVPAGSDESEASIIVVRHQAKTESPLKNLQTSGGEDIITVYAEITVYGHTTNGHRVTATGRLQIVFANFADQEDPEASSASSN
jgi:hypothetical protein